MITADERQEAERCADVIDAWLDRGVCFDDPPRDEIMKAMILLRKTLLAIDLIYPLKYPVRD